ncbi:MAG: DUF2344 domain-containing protein [Desulfitobacterium sp.]|nr:DUF2344 domain-containing protein [Desulfitobacterium sp.]
MRTLRIRIAYTKVEEAKYIAHLDLSRVFERACRRAGIPLAYSQGFNPHPKIAFGSALAVGVEGEQEYVDLELEKEMDLKELLGSLQEQLPKGIRLLEGRQINPKARALMAVLNGATYQIRTSLTLPLTEEKLQKAINDWMDRSYIPYIRYNKKGRVEKDIRPWVKELKGKIKDHEVIFDLEVEIGNQGSVRPEEVIASLKKLEELPLEMEFLRIRRTGIFVSYEGKKVSPLEQEAFGK